MPFSPPSPFRPMSLRMRFVLGVSAMLLPLMLLGAGALSSLQRMTATFEDTLGDPVREMHAVMLLQSRVVSAAMPPNDYLVNGEAAERAKFSRLGAEADRSFDETLALASLWPEQRMLLEAARVEWRKARGIADALLALDAPVGNPAAALGMKRMDAHIERAAALLGETHMLTMKEIDEGLERAHAIQRWMLLMIVGAVGLLGLLITAGSGLLLARYVLVPLHALETGAARLGAGEYSHRVKVNSGDEIEHLADTFNVMAEELEKDREKLEELSTHDGLTGLYNHRMFDVLLDEELARAKRTRRPLALLMLDIDHFKRVNDTHGHQAGDAVLKCLAELLSRQARAIDRVCRYGGEEIALILPDTDNAVEAAERMRASVEAQSFDCGGDRQIHITVSIGVAHFPADADNASALVAASDTALYTAKEGGRNQVRGYRAPGMTPRRGLVS